MGGLSRCAVGPWFGAGGDIVADYGGLKNGPSPSRGGPRVAPPQGKRPGAAPGYGRTAVPDIPTNVGDLWRLQEAIPT